MRAPAAHGPICRGIRVAGTPAIAAPGASYAVDLYWLFENDALLPRAAADSPTGKIDEHREDESPELRRQAVHGTGAAPGTPRRPEFARFRRSLIPCCLTMKLSSRTPHHIARCARIIVQSRAARFLRSHAPLQRLLDDKPTPSRKKVAIRMANVTSNPNSSLRTVSARRSVSGSPSPS